MKFRGDRPEEACPKVIMGDANNPRRWVECGGLICMRTAGHEGKCESLARDAAALDGVCPDCRNPITEPHEAGCPMGKR